MQINVNSQEIGNIEVGEIVAACELVGSSMSVEVQIEFGLDHLFLMGLQLIDVAMQMECHVVCYLNLVMQTVCQ